MFYITHREDKGKALPSESFRVTISKRMIDTHFLLIRVTLVMKLERREGERNTNSSTV